jgi:hypothetical protein
VVSTVCRLLERRHPQVTEIYTFTGGVFPGLNKRLDDETDPRSTWRVTSYRECGDDHPDDFLWSERASKVDDEMGPRTGDLVASADGAFHEQSLYLLKNDDFFQENPFQRASSIARDK